MRCKIESTKIGHRIRDLKNGKFQVHFNDNTAYEGPKLQILALAVKKGLHEEDLVMAITELERLNHDYAEFGTFGRFIFTSNYKKPAA